MARTHVEEDVGPLKAHSSEAQIADLGLAIASKSALTGWR